MALIDVKEYYYTMLNQYLEAKNDLKDFESALQDGQITEDKLVGVQEEVEKLKSNLDRIQYIMYLFELPKRKGKKAKFIEANEELEKYFAEHKVNLKSITDENTSTLTGLRSEIKKLKEAEQNERTYYRFRNTQ